MTSFRVTIRAGVSVNVDATSYHVEADKELVFRDGDGKVVRPFPHHRWIRFGEIGRDGRIIKVINKADI